MSRIMIVGASGFLGSNVLTALQNTNHEVVVVTRIPLNGINSHVVDLSAQLLNKDHPLFLENPDCVIYLARPVNPIFDSYRIFHSNMQLLLLHWSSKSLKQIIFTSTTMVYSGTKEIVTEMDKITDTSPYGVYEYFKLETELFLTMLGKYIQPNICIDVWRLPIVFGGTYNPDRHSHQFLYYFLVAYKEGFVWSFLNEDDKKYGTSWVYTPDLIHMLLSVPTHTGIQIKNITSGFITYFELHSIFTKLLPNIGDKPLKLHKSIFNIKDESGIPQVDILDVYSKIV